MRATRISLMLLATAGVLGTAFFIFQDKDSDSAQTSSDAVDTALARSAEKSGSPSVTPEQAKPNGSYQAEETQALSPSMRGLLIDGQDTIVRDGDIVYKFMPRESDSCEPEGELSFDLDPNTGIVQSNERGRFDIPLPDVAARDDCLHLNASKQGYTATVVSLDLALHAGIIELELEKHQMIRGRVLTPDGSNLAGAVVNAWIANDGEVLNETLSPCDAVDNTSLISQQSLEGGQFNLDVAGDNQFCLQASHPSWASSPKRLISTSEAQSSEVTLTLARPTAVAGRVVDQDGMPVAKLALQLHRVDSTGEVSPLTSHTDNLGEFVFRQLDSADYQLHSGDPAYAVAKPKEISIKAEQSPGRLEVSVFPLTTISGRLVDDRGNPLGGASVSTRSPYLPKLSTATTVSNSQGYFEVRSEHRSQTVGDMLRMAQGFEEGGPVNGNVDNEAFPPRVCISFYHPHFRRDEISTVADKTSVDLGTLYMEAPQLALNGLVQNHRNEPTEAQLSFNYIDPSRNVSSDPPLECNESTMPRTAHADEEGHFALNLDKAGRYEVEVKTQRYKTRRLEVQISGGSELIEIKLD